MCVCVWGGGRAADPTAAGNQRWQSRRAEVVRRTHGRVDNRTPMQTAAHHGDALAASVIACAR